MNVIWYLPAHIDSRLTRTFNCARCGATIDDDARHPNVEGVNAWLNEHQHQVNVAAHCLQVDAAVGRHSEYDAWIGADLHK